MYLAHFSPGPSTGGTYIPGRGLGSVPHSHATPVAHCNLTCYLQAVLRFAPRLYIFKLRPVFRRFEAFTLALNAGTPNSSDTSFRLLQLFHASVNISLLIFSGRPRFFGCAGCVSNTGCATSLARTSRSTVIVGSVFMLLVSFIFLIPCLHPC